MEELAGGDAEIVESTADAKYRGREKLCK